MTNIAKAALFLLASRIWGATLQDKPTSFCYGTTGPGIEARLNLRNTDPRSTVSVAVRVQTVDGGPVAETVHRDLAPGESYEAVFAPTEQLRQIWAVLTVSGYRRARGEISMHSDGPVQGALVTEKTVGGQLKTRTNTLTPILVQDPHDRPRGVEPNKAVHRLSAFFTGEYVFIGNPRDRELNLSFCGARTGKCLRWTLPPRAAVSISLPDFEAALAITNPEQEVVWDFGGATAFCNMRNGSADSAITFSDAP